MPLWDQFNGDFILFLLVNIRDLETAKKANPQEDHALCVMPSTDLLRKQRKLIYRNARSRPCGCVWSYIHEGQHPSRILSISEMVHTSVRHATMLCIMMDHTIVYWKGVMSSGEALRGFHDGNRQTPPTALSYVTSCNDELRCCEQKSAPGNEIVIDDEAESPLRLQHHRRLRA